MINVALKELGPRSLLFVPADRLLDFLPKAMKSGADGIVIDLEDAVDPAVKDAARRSLVEVLSSATHPVPIFVRINPVGSRWFADDAAALDGLPRAGVLIPKCERPDDIHAFLRLQDRVARPLLALIETPRGMLGAERIASTEGVVGLAFGAEDFAAHFGMRPSGDARELVHARWQVALVAAAFSLWSLDSPCVEPRGVERTRREAETARQLGFSGKLAIHPAQIGPVHAAFSPTSDEIVRAREVVAAFEASRNRRSGVATSGGHMIDRPVVLAALRVLARANLGDNRS